MCKTTRFDFDNALECVINHAPRAAATINAYVDQLERERRHLAELLSLYEKHDGRVMDIICGKE